MKTMARQVVLGVFASFAASASFAAAVEVQVVDTAATDVTGCCAATVAAGNAFSLIVHGTDFPTVAGATLGLTWDPAVVSVTNVTAAAGTPFSGGVVAAAPWSPISIIGPLVGTLPSGTFDTFQLDFQALAAGNANIMLVDDQTDLCWSDAATFGCVMGVTYTQANVTVTGGGGPIVPIPSAAWLFGSALLAGGRFLRRKA